MEENKETKILNERNAGWYNNFLWWCAGVNRDVLRQCPTEWAKYAGMGGTIFSTACMAALSGGYAISTVFDNTVVAFLFGIFWGFIIIFNLDRLIVNTMFSDGEVTISWLEFKSGLPRIIMAFFLGIIISTPLELKIYEKSINTKIKTLKQDKLKELLADDEAKLEEYNIKKDQILSRDVVDLAASGAGEAYSSNNKELSKLQAEYNQLQSRISNYVTQRRHVSQIDNPKEYNKLSALIHNLSVKRNSLRPQIIKLQAEIAGNNKDYMIAVSQNSVQKKQDIENIDKDIAAIKEKINNSEKVYKPQLDDEFDGFQGRMMAFDSMKPWFSPTWWTSLCISLLFIIIECAPTFMRMMVADGSYEKILEAEKHKIRVMADKRISDINDEINTEVKISTEKNRQRLDAELLANKELMDKVIKTQTELLQIALDKWREEELAKINENPSAYIKTNNAS
jgi:hypothetical protein